MSEKYKYVNGREVIEIMYDELNRICTIHYNHHHEKQMVYFHGVTREEFDKVYNSDNIAGIAEIVFKDKRKEYK